MGKYAKYVSPMFLRQDEVKRPHRPGTWVFGQEYRFLTEYCKFTPCLVEFMPLYGPQNVEQLTDAMGTMEIDFDYSDYQF